MAKKKRQVRKPINKVERAGDRPVSPAEDDCDSTGKGSEVFKEAVDDLGEELGQTEIRFSPGLPDFHTPQVSSSWAKEVELEQGGNGGQELFQESAKSLWQSFAKEKVTSRDSKLSFTEPLFQDGVKIAQVDVEEVREQSESWNSAVICMILGANPPLTVFEGFLKRVWGHLGIVQIARMSKGLVMVKFQDEVTRDEVLEAGVLQFDRKPVIVRPWTTDLNAVKLVRSVPLWIRLHDLGLQYWGNKSLSALVSTIGKPIMVDQHTKDRTRIQFARILVEMDISDSPPRSFQFLNEYGQLIEQRIDYEWLPVKCKNCLGFGHIMADCRRDEMKKKLTSKDKPKPGFAQQQVTDVVSNSVSEPENKLDESTQVQTKAEVNGQGVWHKPKKTIQGNIKKNLTGNDELQQQQVVMNSFSALQQGSREEANLDHEQEGHKISTQLPHG
ncbi:uncharacterized protein LOC115717493 [Cannabis sativa]|uniref:uncharacterized protein LOC115717493 n=1 Tax=Cannabis sativa TaxID=3483 RepID=UPI0011DF584F|nr:uncharacterized protein LOC115717493 [Cannabis sativa]